MKAIKQVSFQFLYIVVQEQTLTINLSCEVDVATRLQSYVRTLKAQRLIISVGSGQCSTELQSDELCLCLDSSKRSLFAAAMTNKFLVKSTSTLFYHFIVSDNLHMLVEEIKKSIAIPIHILFQHPSPTDRDMLSLAGRSCRKLMMSGAVKRVVIVYDDHQGRNCYNYVKICGILLGEMTGERQLTELLGVKATNATILCDTPCNEYEHPLLGQVTRKGWSLLRKSRELCFEMQFRDSDCEYKHNIHL